MFLTSVYYFLAFLVFVSMMAGLQKWSKLTQSKKDKIGLEVLSLFLISLFAFIFLVATKSSFISSDQTVFGGMLFFFLSILFLVLIINWYNEKYHKKINIARVVVLICLTAFGIIFVILKSFGSDEKQKLIQDISLKTVVTKITFDTHKPYFKDMQLADGQNLPMPETMNGVLQIGDSIYKIKGENFYTVFNPITKMRRKFEVKIHERVLGKAQ